MGRESGRRGRGEEGEGERRGKERGEGRRGEAEARQGEMECEQSARATDLNLITGPLAQLNRLKRSEWGPCVAVGPSARCGSWESINCR